MTVPPAPVFNLLKGNISYSDAVESEENILQQLSYPKKRKQSCISILERQDTIAAVVAHHLRVDPQHCRVTHPIEWKHGSFNWSIPVLVDCNNHHKVLLRIPLNYKFGDRSDSMDEKVRCEAATYIILQTQCPDVPIPKLWGFGLTSGITFRSLETFSLASRIFFTVENFFRVLLRWPVPCSYIAEEPNLDLGLSYLLLEYIEGDTLYSMFEEKKKETQLRTNLFTDISRIILSVGKIQSMRIGSFTIGNDGVIGLSNRPLTLLLPILENEGVPPVISPARTYEDTLVYALDLLDYHDGRILHQPNSVSDEEDAKRQMAVSCHMRAVLSQSILTDYRNGPFPLTLTDLHPSNIFVDDDWHIRSLIDLEGAATLPRELSQLPLWLTGKADDQLVGEDLDEFEECREEFMSIFRSQEQLMFPEHDFLVSILMQKSWVTGAFWYFAAIQSNKLFNIFYRHVRTLYISTQESTHASTHDSMDDAWRFWSPRATDVVHQKLKDREQYLRELEQQAISFGSS